MMCTKQQQQQQTEGPHRPFPHALSLLLESIPSHHEIRAISINAQAGVVVIEAYHEELDVVHVFPSAK